MSCKGTRGWQPARLPGFTASGGSSPRRARAPGALAAVVIASIARSRDETLDRLLREFLLGGAARAAASRRWRATARRRCAAARRGDAPTGRLDRRVDAGQHDCPMPRSRDELSRLAETLNDMLARLEAAFEHERRFVDDASHELRTPLALLRRRARTRPAAPAFAGRSSSARCARRRTKRSGWDGSRRICCSSPASTRGRLPIAPRARRRGRAARTRRRRFERRAPDAGRPLRRRRTRRGPS